MAVIALDLVTTKIFPCGLIAVQTVIYKRFFHWARNVSCCGSVVIFSVTVRVEGFLNPGCDASS